jgi:hypothetical protein
MYGDERHALDTVDVEGRSDQHCADLVLEFGTQVVEGLPPGHRRVGAVRSGRSPLPAPVEEVSPFTPQVAVEEEPHRGRQGEQLPTNDEVHR